MTDFVPEPDQLRLQERICRTECSLWHLCGGSSEAAPCGCVWKDADRRYECHRCPLICRERRASPDSDVEVKDFLGHLAEVRELAQVSVSQPDNTPQLPVLIPDRTNQLNLEDSLPLDWAALNATSLIGQGGRPGPGLRAGPHALRDRLNVTSSCKVLGVLNGQDKRLEQFWGGDRLAFYQVLEECGISPITGPTYSVNQESAEHPAAHNLMMLLRHHQVLHELSQSPLTGVPNLYWRDRKSQKRWVDWLNTNDSISVISRDFSRTKSGVPFWKQFEGLLEILEAIVRPLHVILSGGVGRIKGGAALAALSTVNATGTVVTSEPILKGQFGRAYRYRGADLPGVVKDSESDRSKLSIRNLQVMERHLGAVTEGLTVRYQHTQNGTLQDAHPQAEVGAALEKLTSGVDEAVEVTG